MTTSNECITPERAIRNAHNALRRERLENARKQTPERDEIDTMIGDEMESLELALQYLKEYRDLKAVLKAVLS